MNLPKNLPLGPLSGTTSRKRVPRNPLPPRERRSVQRQSPPLPVSLSLLPAMSQASTSTIGHQRQLTTTPTANGRDVGDVAAAVAAAGAARGATRQVENPMRTRRRGRSTTN